MLINPLDPVAAHKPCPALSRHQHPFVSFFILFRRAVEGIHMHTVGLAVFKMPLDRVAVDVGQAAVAVALVVRPGAEVALRAVQTVHSSDTLPLHVALFAVF